MKHRVKVVFGILLGVFIAFTSCDKDIDMAMEHTSEPKSLITSDLIVTTLAASSFIDKSTLNERSVTTDTLALNLIGTDFLKEELIKTTLSIQFINSLHRDFRVDFEFLDDLNEVKFELQIPISAASKEEPKTVNTSVMIEASELTRFKEATKLVYKFTLLPSDDALSSESLGQLDLQSEMTYFFDI